MDPSEVEFLAEKELVKIIPNFSLDKIYLIGVGKALFLRALTARFTFGNISISRITIATLAQQLANARPYCVLGVIKPHHHHHPHMQMFNEYVSVCARA